MPEISDALAKQAAAIQSTLNADVIQARNNPALTPEGRLRELAIAYTRSKQQMDALRDSWSGSTSTQVAAIDKDVFGATNVAGVDAISVRDAADRASRLESGEDAMRLLDQAELTGDEVLARAVVQYAYSQRGPFSGAWRDVVDAYASRRPEVAQKLADLEAASRSDAATSLAAAFVLSVFKPSELERLSDYRITVLAETVPAPRPQTQAERNRAIGSSQTGYDWLSRHQGLS